MTYNIGILHTRMWW